MDKASEAILALKPVTFHYKSDRQHAAVWFDRRGSGRGEPGPGGARRERRDLHRALRRGERDVAQRVPQRAPQSERVERRTIDVQACAAAKQIEALTAGLQKVSAQLEASKPAPQVVNNP